MSKKKNIFAVHANYAKSNVRPNNDLVVVKEHVIEEDGSVSNNLRFFENFKRDFYVTKKRYRNHNSKKITESLKKLDKFSSTQAALEKSVAKALGCKPNKMRTMARSPYLYGTDVHVTNVILKKYREMYGEAPMMPTVGVMDYEWDVDTKSPTIGAYVFEDTLYLVVVKELISMCGYNIVQFKHAVFEGFKEHVQPLIDAYFEREGKPTIKFKVKLDVVDLDLDVVRKSFAHTHITMPDYLTFWNGEADMETIEAQCTKYHVQLADFMCDPSIPKEYRNTRFMKGADKTIDANGKPKNRIPSERWHVLENLASWQFIDIMCCYHTNRAHLANLPSYSMDFVLNLELKMGKLKLVDELAHLEKSDPAKWHKEMSTKHIVEYTLYAGMDVIGPLLLELKNFEISSQAYSEIDINPIGDFKKNPRKLANSNHFNFMQSNEVIASTSDQMSEEFDDLIYSANNWIITLNSSYHDTLETRALADSSQPVLYIPSCDDGDLTSSYPSNQRLLNTDKSTTVTEVTYTVNIPEELMREIGLDVASHGHNSIDFCKRVLGLPHFDQILEIVDGQSAA